MRRRPALLLDVDGVLNVWSMTDPVPDGWKVHEAVPDGLGGVWRLVMNTQHGEWLNALAVDGLVDLVWCTTWWRVANDVIARRAGMLGDFPAVFLPYRFDVPPAGYAAKTPFVRQWAAEYEVTHLAWLDDDVDEAADRTALMLPASTRDQRLAGIEPVEDALVIKVDPRIGLTQAHIDRVRAWAEHLRKADEK